MNGIQSILSDLAKSYLKGTLLCEFGTALLRLCDTSWSPTIAFLNGMKFIWCDSEANMYYFFDFISKIYFSALAATIGDPGVGCLTDWFWELVIYKIL